jgi:hypothetical protein
LLKTAANERIGPKTGYPAPHGKKGAIEFELFLDIVVRVVQDSICSIDAWNITS